jgi:outer membrane protein assembly factor BamD (BamD/ComL family)
MIKYKMLFVILAAATLVFTSSAFSAETWRLGEEGQWKGVSAEDKYPLAVSEIKKMVDMGETKAVGQAIDKLKKDFPAVAGLDLDAFMKAEMLFCEGKFTKAVRSYDKFLAEFPTSKLYEAAMEREFGIATAFLGGQKKRVLGVFMMSRYDEGVKVMEKITDRAGDAAIGVKAAVAVAEHYEKRGKFAEAYQKWSEVSSRWPTGQIGKDALLSMARCKHAGYKGPRFNGSDLISARSYYENFKLRYPEEAKKIDADKILKQIDEQLAYKEFSTGKFYQESGDKQAADLYYQMVVNNWPDSTAAKMAKDAMKEKEPEAKKGKKWKKNITEKLEKLLL